MDARLKPEVQHQADLEFCCPQIVEELTLRYFGLLDARLHLEEKSVIDNHIDSLHRDDVILVGHMYTHFSRDAMTTLEKLAFESHYIHMFEEAEAKRIVYLEKGANDGPREFLFQ